jgi:AraC-like DNA-binding protein
MKAQLINRTIIQDKSFSIESHCDKNFLKIWHYHPEIELILVLAGTGTRFIGDSIEKFKPGEIILMGRNIPHMWMYDKIYFKGSPNLQAKSLVVHFHDNFLAGLSKISEMSGINALFTYANRGIKFKDPATENFVQEMNRMLELDGYNCNRVLLLLDVLKQLSEKKRFRMLSSPGYVSAFNEKQNSKVMPVYEYIMNNFTEGICLDKAASLAHMNTSAFSRYFKRIHKKTFITFVNEIKIGYACKLLLEQKYTISQICYESGFNNISNFNRQFKSQKQVTPSQFIATHCGTD